METIKKNTVFTNVAETSDGGVFWEGLEDEMDLSQVSVTSWLGQENWTKESGKPFSHPNSRFIVLLHFVREFIWRILDARCILVYLD